MAGEPESTTDQGRPVRAGLALLFVASVVVLLAPGGNPGGRAIPVTVFFVAVVGSILVGWEFFRGRPWASTVILLGMLLVQGVFLAGLACMNNLKYLTDTVQPLAQGYLFDNMLRVARWMGMPTRNLATSLLSIGLILGLLLVLPTIVVVRHLRRLPPESYTWVRDLSLVLIISTLIWNAAMIGLTLRPFRLGYLW
jgi:hypothetical protein